MTQKEIIDYLRLEQHIEGGYFSRTYASTETLSTNRNPPERNLLTCIYYLLTKESPIGYFHLNESDIHHFYQLGSPIRYFTISPMGELETFILGPDLKNNHYLQKCVKGGFWKSSILESGEFGLIGEAVAPGFHSSDAKLATPESFKLLFPELWPQIHHLIKF